MPHRTLCLLLAAVFTAVPAFALMEFYGTEYLGENASWPDGLGDLLNQDNRFACAVGPVADWKAAYSGDNEALSTFLTSLADMADTTIKVYIHKGHFTYDMHRYDNSERKQIADWTMQISEYWKSRPNEAEFGGQPVLVTVRINPTNQIDLDKLDIPVALAVEASPEYEEVEKRHAARREQARKNGQTE